MLRDRVIICIGSAWDYDPTSKHQIMKVLARENRILWINYHGSRCPSINRVDLRDSYSALQKVARGIRRVSPSIVQLTPMVIPGAISAPLQWLHQRLLIAQIRRALRIVNPDQSRPVQVWSFAPDVPYLVDAFDEECFIYYCVDEFTEFEGYSADRIRNAERHMLDRADVVITSSESLYETKRVTRPDTLLVRHGVDHDHFASAWRNPKPLPSDLATIPRPIFGYFGLVHHWVDLELLEEIAKLRPLYSFVMIGDCKVDVSRVAKLSNVFLLGRRAYEDLPAYCSAFEGAMMLFTRTSMTRNVNPIKMYEYLAAGLPIISTPLPEAERLTRGITIAETAQDFVTACDKLLAEQEHANPEAISEIVAHETWEAKVEHLSNIIMDHTNPPRRTTSKPKSEVGPWSVPTREPTRTTNILS
jgi:glycosyltransferase involved in cell wall biosynthesis